MKGRELSVLFENLHYLVVYKPPGYLSQPGLRKDSRPILFDELVKQCANHDIDTSEWRTVHRLDACVSGGMLIAKTKNAATMFGRNLKYGGNKGYGLVRRYVAMVDPTKSSNLTQYPPTGVLKSDNMVTKYKRVRNNCLIVELVTGKKHQIRKQLSGLLNSPILYDQKYGSEQDMHNPDQIALHSAFIETTIGRTSQNHLIPVQLQDRSIWDSITTNEGYFIPEINHHLCLNPW